MDREQFRRIQIAPQLLPRLRGRHRHHRAGAAAGAGRPRAPPASRIPLAPRKPHFAPKAKNVIFMFMEGGPSQIDLFDPKPELQKWNGKPLPPEMTKDLRLAFTKPNAAVLASPRTFTAARPERHRILRLHPAHRLLRRRPLPGALDVHRRLQSSSRAVAALRRQHPGGASDDGRVGALRTRQRIAESAGLRGAEFGRGHQRRSVELVAADFCRRPIRAWCSAARAIRCCTFRTRRASRARCSAPASTR